MLEREMRNLAELMQEWRPRRILDSLLNACTWWIVGFTTGYALGFWR